MDPRITHQHIASEASRIQRITGNSDHTANWYEAIENLNIFPWITYDISGVQISQTFFTPSREDFAFIYRSVHLHRHYLSWYSCREVFERDLYYYGSSHGNFRFGFIVTSPESTQARVPNFIRDIETSRLTLGELTTFMKIRNRRNWIYVRPSSFWTCCQMRFSLFTILMRAGSYYYFNSIEDALMKNEYSRKTFAAIKVFFEGRRNYVGGTPDWKHKWVAHYQHLSESQVYNLAY